MKIRIFNTQSPVFTGKNFYAMISSGRGNTLSKEQSVKKYSLFLIGSLCAGILSGCVGTTLVYQDCTTVPADGDGEVKTGLSIVASPSVDNAAGQADHAVALVAVLTRGDIILDCVIDGLSTSVTFDESGTITSPDGVISTKNELGYAYGMVTQGGSKYEWFQQAQALADYAQGKTVSQVTDGYAGDAELATSASIYLGGLVEAMAVAVTNAKALGAAEGDKLQLASRNSLSGGDLSCDAVALTTREGVITSCCLDSLEATLVFEDGMITVGNTSTKNQLGYDYGMVSWGGARYEWFQQAEHFAAYVTGKTAQQVASIAVTEAGKAGDADLAASVTISIADFQALIAKTDS